MARLRTKKIFLSAGFLGLIPAVTACAVEPNTYEICMEEATVLRAYDTECESGSSGHSWVYVHGHAPAVGRPISQSYSTVRTGVIGRASANGETVSSGG